MKSIILIAVLAALTACYDAASDLPSSQEETVLVEESGQSFIKDYDLEGVTGRVSRNDDLILFYTEFVDIPALPNTVQFRDVFYRGNSTTQINRISMSDMPVVPGHTHITNFWTHATIRFTIAPGTGFRSLVRIFGVYTDWV